MIFLASCMVPFEKILNTFYENFLSAAVFLMLLRKLQICYSFVVGPQQKDKKESNCTI